MTAFQINEIYQFFIAIIIGGICICCSKEDFYTAKIVNESNTEMIVKIQYDKNSIDKKYGDNSYQLGTLSIENYPQISFDPKTLISTLKLMPKDSLLVEYGNVNNPKFEILKSISIYSNDTLLLDNREKIINGFIEMENHLLILKKK
ncbi:MAG: hypothetical protein V4572_05570 [Bacteroidota bacterium]